MGRTILVSVATVAIALAPSAFAQSEPEDSRAAMATEQRASYDSWPPERQRIYDAWEPTIQTYYWTLNPEQERGWWLLTDAQRATLFRMTPQERVQAWTAINAQLAEAATATSTRSARASNANIRFVRNSVVQPIPGDQAAVSGGDVPVCGPNEYDNCMNAWEAGLRGPNVTKPLDYWPGEPADPRSGE